jgi:hypothetical protein
MQTPLPELNNRSRELLESWGVELNLKHPLSSHLPPGWCWVPGDFNDHRLQDPIGHYRASYYGILFVFPCRYRVVTTVEYDRETQFDYRSAIVQDRARGLEVVARFKGFSYFLFDSEWTAIQENGGIYGLRNGEFELLHDRKEFPPVTNKQSLFGFDQTQAQEWNAAYDRLVLREATKFCDQRNREANWEIVESPSAEKLGTATFWGKH